MSAPALKALSPAPVMMAQRICGSSRTRLPGLRDRRVVLGVQRVVHLGAVDGDGRDAVLVDFEID